MIMSYFLDTLLNGENFGASVSASTHLAEYISPGKEWKQRTSGRQNVELLEATLNHAIEETCVTHWDR